MAVSRAELLKELLPGLEKLFGMEYTNYMKPQYSMRCVYGKWRIYKVENLGIGRTRSTTLVKGLDKETAEGMMKLLVDNDE